MKVALMDSAEARNPAEILLAGFLQDLLLGFCAASPSLCKIKKLGNAMMSQEACFLQHPPPSASPISHFRRRQSSGQDAGAAAEASDLKCSLVVS